MKISKLKYRYPFIVKLHDFNFIVEFSSLRNSWVTQSSKGFFHSWQHGWQRGPDSTVKDEGWIEEIIADICGYLGGSPRPKPINLGPVFRDDEDSCSWQWFGGKGTKSWYVMEVKSWCPWDKHRISSTLKIQDRDCGPWGGLMALDKKLLPHLKCRP